MIDDQYIIDFFSDKNGKINTKKVTEQYLLKHAIDIKYYLETRYSDFISYTHTVKCIFNHFDVLPRCETCNAILKNPLATYCSDKCRANGYSYKQKMEQLYIDKYGVKNPAQAEEVKEKIKKTNNIKYGVDNVYQSEIIKEKSKQTKFKKYNDKNYNNTKKRKATMNSKYNADAFSQTIEYNKKRKRKYEYDGYRFDSIPEIVFYIYHRDLGHDIKHEPCQFEYEYDNKIRKYNPDFEINGQLYEIKGKHFFENGKMINPFDRSQDDLYEAKYQCMKKNGVIVVSDFSEYFDYVLNKYGEDYINSIRKEVL